MADQRNCVTGVSWRLRASTPQVVCATNTQDCLCNEDQSGVTSRFILQTFGAEKRETRNYRATTRLAESADMIGLNPQGTLESASYQGTNYIDQDGEVMFTGQEQALPEYTTEDQMPGVTDFVF